MIAPTELNAVTEQLRHQGINTNVVSQLRKEFPERHFTYCLQDDITNGHPVVEEGDFAVYLVDANEHCLEFTTDLTRATGFVLAEVLED